MPRPKADSSPSFPLASGMQVPAESSEVGMLSLPEKQELLYVAARTSGCREALESWKRKDLLQLLCLEMGKERKYTGIPKSKMVDHLLRLVSLKGGKEDLNAAVLLESSAFSSQSQVRRQRKGGRPSRLPAVTQISMGVDERKHELIWMCKNSACKAQLSPGVPFCKRCSCCICHRFDDNKDPSLWIVCTSDAFDGESECSLSCHIECALDQELAGVVTDAGNTLLDGSYRCESCGRIGDLIGCWRKQLLIAKDARRVDILCHRLSLSHRLLNGTHCYKELHDIVDKATKKLESEVGSITEGSAKLVRGLVNRLSSGADVQKLIGLALEKAESLFLNPQSKASEPKLKEEPMTPFCTIQFQDISSASISVTVKGQGHLAGEELVGYKLWHRKAGEWNYPRSPTCVIRETEGTALVSDLQACTEYVFRVVPFSSGGDAAHTEARCFTKSLEVIQKSVDLQPPLAKTVTNQQGEISKVMNVENELPYGSVDFVTNFKVRDLGKVLHTAWSQDQQSIGVMEGIFGSTERSRILESEKQVEYGKMGEHVSPALNVLLSPGADTSSVEDGGCKPRQGGADASSVDDGGCKPRQTGRLCHLDLPEDLNAGTDEGRVTVEMGLVDTPAVKAISRKDSNGLMKENQGMQCMQCPKEGLLGHVKVMEADEVSDPSNSQTARGEEIDDVSPVASGSLRANGVSRLTGTMVRTNDLESNGHGESWAVQVRRGGTSIEMEPQTGIVRKRTVGGLEGSHNCYGLMNGCAGTGNGASVCAAKSYEFCVKIIRWLECEGHLKEDFRMKFLTWFSLRATDHEKRVVSVFIDTLQDNPTSLAGQLVDTFGDIVSAKRQQVVPNGFCNRLWH